MINKILQYKRIIGEAITLTRQNNELAQKNHDLARQNNELVQQGYELTWRNNELFTKTINQLSYIVSENRDTFEHLKLHIESQLEQLELQVKMQNEISTVNTTAFADYKNIHEGRDIVVMGAGPTLDKYYPLENAIHIGVNSVCTKKEISLDYYFTQDFRGDDSQIQYKSDITNLNCRKFFGLLADTHIIGVMEPSQSFSFQANATRYYVDRSPSKYLFPDICFHPLMDFCSVVFPALHFALFTNPRRIFLVGCDSSYSGYFRHGKQLDTINQKRHYLNIMLVGFRRLKEFAQTWYPDTEIVSINPVNLRGLFRDMYTDKLEELYDSTDIAVDMGFSDASIKSFVDKHIENELLRRMSTELSCEECGQRCFSIVRGLSDDFSSGISVKCDECGYSFDYQQLD